jgi:opacity protein-like surface antigen
LLFSGVSAFAAPFSFGVKAGVPLTDFFTDVGSLNSPFSSTTNRYIVGPTVELHLPFHLSVELDALYRHFNYSVPSNTTTGSAWEFPLLGKYRFRGELVRPYVDAGVAWDTLSGLTQSIQTQQLELQNNTTTGFVVGAGLEVHVPFLRLSPEFRYTRWGAQHFLDPNGGFGSNQNQAEFLLGITF